ncbi:hypothetical protein ABT174_04990 [Streptomyces sparsogenes]|uniref:hypothetical protein n=1 Tax=Streptomyces sparsogenes TaxID=67365 RepID=UPI00331F3283
MSDSEAEQRLKILLADYGAGRDDERSLTFAYSAVTSVAVTALGIIAAGSAQTCQLKHNQCLKINDWVLAGAPLLPLAAFSFAQMLGTVSVLRSYYLRALEHELRLYIREPLKTLGSVGPASYMGIVQEVVSLRRGRLAYRVLANLILVAILLVFGGLIFYIATGVAPRVQIAMGVTYGSATFLLLIEAMAATVWGRGLFIAAAHRFAARRGTTTLPQIPTEPSGERSLISYLLLPRPEELVKWLISPCIFLAATWSTGSFEQWPKFMVLWLVLEYLIYEARYQWNDLRGSREDTRHAEKRARARLPVGKGPEDARRSIFSSLVVIGLRLAAAVTVGVATGLLAPILWLIGLVLGIGIAYEALRAQRTQARKISTSIYFTVGLGYTVRAGIGFEIGGISWSSWVAIAGEVSMATFGAMFSLMVWVLEATSFCLVLERTRIPLNTAHEWYETEELEEKPHIRHLLLRVKPLLRITTNELDPKEGEFTLVAYGGDSDILNTRVTDASKKELTLPWNIAYAISATFCSIAGFELAHPYSISYLCITIIIGSTCAIWLALIAKNSVRWLVLLLCTALLVGSGDATSAVRQPALVALPWLLVSATYCSFRSQSYSNLKAAFPRTLENCRKLAGRLLRLLIGETAYRSMGYRTPP